MTGNHGGILLFFLAALLPEPCLAADQLWDAAVKVFEANLGWTPGRVTISSLEYNSDGILKNEEILSLVNRGGSEGEFEVESAIKNGKDVTEERRREEQKKGNRGSGPPDDSEDLNPFDPTLQDRVSYRRTGETRLVGNRMCLGYAFSIRGEKRFSYRGTAWLDAAAGTPIRVDLELEKLPPFVTLFSMRTTYSADPLAWYPLEMEMEAAGTIIVHQAYRTRITFSGYRRP